MWGNYFEFFPRSRPRQAKGGIKAQSKRGQFGSTWWAKRWIAVLESFQIGARLGRGRSYARSGQVLNVNISKGKVTAQVQGSRPDPYDVTIQVAQLSVKEWSKLLDVLGGQALFLAKLLGGEMPQDIENVFRDAGLSLFPQKLRDLQTSCSCPDYSNPCKHIAAVYYLLGEEFDRDPFLIFQLRGMGRDELLKQLGKKGEAAAPAAEPAAPVEPLPTSPAKFWTAGPMPENLFEHGQVPSASAAWPRRLGHFPFWRGTERFLDALDPIYRETTHRALNAFLGERKG
jgi:uncharacterized Zn finger protein